MKAQVITKKLYEAVKAATISGSRSTLPVLNHMLLCSHDGGLALVATNLDETKTEFCSAKIYDNDFACLVPFKTQAMRCDAKTKWKPQPTGRTLNPFLDWLKVMCVCEELLTLDYDEKHNVLIITAGNTKARFNCLDADEFPPTMKPARPTASPEPTPEPVEFRSPAESPAPVTADTARAEILARYAWIERWENDPTKRMYKSTLHNARVNLRNELAALDAAQPIDVTGIWPARVTVTA